MKVCIIGAGYVGLTTAAVLANFGHHVYCIDIDQEKVASLNQGKIPIYEPGLKEIVQENLTIGRLSFGSDRKQISESEIVFIAVGTPTQFDGNADLSYVYQVTDTISESIHSYTTIIVKSTVPPGTSQKIHERLITKGIDPTLFDVVSNPEFLKEGTAIQDTLYPDKIVVGVLDAKPVPTIQSLYRGIQAPYIVTSLTGAEMIKYASNAFLATKISFINEMARICDAYHVEIDDVALGLGTDPRIGPYFLKAGLGFGGSCLPKDTKALRYAALNKQVNPELLTAVRRVNDEQINFVLMKLRSTIGEIKDKRITIWGLTFKPDTDDTRESQSIKLVHRLVDEGAMVNTFDPIASINLPKVANFKDQYASVKQADALIIATDWSECKKANWLAVKKLMTGSLLLDARNCIEQRLVKQLGFTYIGVGRS